MARYRFPSENPLAASRPAENPPAADSLAEDRPAEPVPVNLAAHADNTGITRADDLSAGAFNVWGNTFPADELPSAGTVVVAGIPFRFPAGALGEPDNVRCAGQLIELPAGRYDWIHLLAAAERRTEDQILLHYRDGGVDPEWLRVSDFWPQTGSRFAGSPAYAFSRMHYPHHVERRMGPVIWRHRVPVPRESDLAAVRLPDNPAVHIFAMTLVPAQAVLPAQTLVPGHTQVPGQTPVPAHRAGTAPGAAAGSAPGAASGTALPQAREATA